MKATAQAARIGNCSARAIYAQRCFVTGKVRVGIIITKVGRGEIVKLRPG